MKIISHRGNILGPNSLLENSPNYILDSLSKGFDVEIDIWIKENKKLYLGHDAPEHEIDPSFLESFKDNLWLHCKDIESLEYLHRDFNCFFIEKEQLVLTSFNYPWIYTGCKTINNCIIVLPESYNYLEDDFKKCYGICTDFAEKYRTELIK